MPSNSNGFCVAMTRNGWSSLKVRPSTLTWASFIASSRADWVRGRGAVDLVGQDDVGEDRPALELEGPGLGVVDADADDVRRQQVRGELDAGEGQVEAAGQGPGQHGLAHAGGILDQQVPSAHQPDQHLGDGVRLAQEDPVDVVPQLGHSGQQRIVRQLKICFHKYRPFEQ